MTSATPQVLMDPCSTVVVPVEKCSSPRYHNLRQFEVTIWRNACRTVRYVAILVGQPFLPLCLEDESLANDRGNAGQYALHAFYCMYGAIQRVPRILYTAGFM